MPKGIHTGLAKHPLYSIWRGMKQRCHEKTNRDYESYGGRGIFVCERWIHDFPAFLEDMGERPVGYQLDRIDNDGPYSPENCRWATRMQQMANRRTLNQLQAQVRELERQVEHLTERLDQALGRATNRRAQP